VNSTRLPLSSALVKNLSLEKRPEFEDRRSKYHEFLDKDNKNTPGRVLYLSSHSVTVGASKGLPSCGLPHKTVTLEKSVNSCSWGWRGEAVYM
jgi:hypothetical protein